MASSKFYHKTIQTVVRKHIHNINEYIHQIEEHCFLRKNCNTFWKWFMLIRKLNGKRNLCLQISVISYVRYDAWCFANIDLALYIICRTSNVFISSQ